MKSTLIKFFKSQWVLKAWRAPWISISCLYLRALRIYTPHFSTAGVFDPSNAAIHVAQNALNFFGSSAMW